jgi:Phage tail tube protein
MAERIAGIALLMVNGQQMALRGNFIVSPGTIERTMLAGQDGIHGYQELPRVPYIEGDISTVRDLDLLAIEAQTNATVIAQLANGKQYVLGQASCKGSLEANTRDGQLRVRWEGVTCLEMNL